MAHQLGSIGRVLVLGLGKSGKSVTKYCADLLGTRVSSLFVAAGTRNDDSEAFLAQLADRGVEYAFGDTALERFAGDETAFDICIASPGIPYWHELYELGSSLSRELVSEVEFAWRESAPESVWVAITGTNGKTTTTSCCAHVLRECGFAADAVGNIGDVCLDAVAAGKTQVYVAEVSSYQLYSTSRFAPDIAVMLNITPDHIHWHKTFEAYADAKFKVFENMRPGKAAFNPVAIFDAVNGVVRAKLDELQALSKEERGFDLVAMGTADGIHGDMRMCGGTPNAAFLDADDVLHVAYDGVDHSLIKAGKLQIKGEHNASNALAAATVAVVLGAKDADIVRALEAFPALEHRIEPCGEVDGVECVNDSKATNVDATLKALGAFPGQRVIVLLGGDDKGTDLAELVESTLDHAHAVVCFGAAGVRFEQAFDAVSDKIPPDFRLVRANHLEDALDEALSIASAGDVVLLSPACASFDEFTSFEQRGKAFKQMVAERASRTGRVSPEAQEG